MAKEELSEEHLALLREAEELGVDTIGYTVPNARLDSLRAAIARQTEALAREAAAKKRMIEAADEEEIEAAEQGAFDEVMGETRGVLVRIVEWTEWLPIGASDHEPRLSLANGVTGFEAGENERLLTVEALGTQRIKHVEDEGLTSRFMLYAFKATLAQNVHTTLVATLVDAQGGNDEGEEQRPRPQTRIITPEDGPNRAQRRHG